MRRLIQLSLCRHRDALRRLAVVREEAGSALIELAFMLAFLGVPLLLGTVHFSILLIDSMIVSNAAHAGAEYGMQSSTYAADAGGGIQAAAQEDASGLGTTLNVSPSIFYVCSTAISGTQYASATAATSACSSGHSLEFVQVNATAAVTPALGFPGFPSTVTVGSTSIMEVEE